MNDNVCHLAQESIASGAHLSAEHQQHLGECAGCQRVLEEYRQLEALFAFNDVVIPEGFVETVMAQIGDAAGTGRNDWFAVLQGRVASLIIWPFAQWLLLSFAVLMSILNLMRFVLFLLIPAY